MIMQESSGPIETVHTGMKKQSMSSSSSSSSTAAEAAADYEIVWKNLVHWVETEHGGYVHKALNLGIEHDDDDDDKLLTTTFQNRGVIAMNGSIEKGELLIRLPACCVLSGKSLLEEESSKILPITTEQRELLASKSSWMQCIAAYYYYNNTARNKNENCNSSSFYDPYLASLPKTYETLFQWTNEEIEKHLGGTTLGTLVQADRKSNSMKLRYQTAVRPVLETLGLLVSSSSSEQDLMEQEMEMFLEACNCISTRGFHYSSFMNSSLSLSSLVDSSYHGPFLLPVIDLLNHNPSKSCTTLQYNHDDGTFSMTAERYIAKGEAIVHSYGGDNDDSLTSGQLLQTFGFVVPPPSTNTNTTKSNRTAACLSKTKHLLPACLAIKQSNIPNRLQSKLKNKNKKKTNNVVSPDHDDDDDDPEVWNVQDIPTRDHHQLLADDILLLEEEDDEDDDDCTTALPDGLITFLCMQFLPQDAYEELYPTNNHNNNNNDDYSSLSVLLDSSIILEDLYLGILVCRSLLLAMNMKLNDYYENSTTTTTTQQQQQQEKKKNNDVCLCEITNQVSNRIATMLLHMKRPDDPVIVANDNDNNNSKQQHEQQQSTSTTTVLRSMYGWTIRREEWISIQILCTKVTNRMKKLYKKLNHNQEDDTVRPPLQKRSKTGPSEI